MVTYMNNQKTQNLDNIRALLEGTTEVQSSIEGKDERYRWISHTFQTIAPPLRGVIVLSKLSI